MTHYNLIQTLTTNKPARYSINGVRVSRDKYENVIQQAHMYGRVECLATKAWSIDNGGTKRKNYTTAIIGE